MSHTLAPAEPVRTPLLSFEAEAPEPSAVMVDLTTLLTTRLIVTGDSRTGKTRMVRQLLEQTYGRLPHLIMDPEGDYSSLREKFDYLLVGRGGEVAADVATAGILAKRLFELRASAIFDLSDMKPKPQQEYVAAFMLALMEVHQTEGHPTLVVVDEAQRFASEQGREVSHDSLWDLSTRGGKRGFCLVAVTPRLSEFSKSVAGGLANRLVFRTTLDVDVDRAGKSLGFRKAVDRDVLLKLPRGQCFAYGPAIQDSERVFRVRGVEHTLTTHFDVTKGVRPAPPPSTSKVRALVSELRDVAIAAQEERSELERLRARVGELEGELEEQAAKRPVIEKPSIDESEIARRVAEAMRRGAERGAEDVRAKVLRPLAAEAQRCEQQLTRAVDDLSNTLVSLNAVVLDLAHAADAKPLEEAPPTPRATEPAPRATERAARAPTHAPTHAPAETNGRRPEVGKVAGGAQQRILNAIALLERVGVVETTHSRVAAIARVSTRSGSWAPYLSKLRTAGMIRDVRRGVIALTAAGRARADMTGMPTTRAELHAYWLREIGDGTVGRILRTLLEAHPKPVSKQAIAEMVGVSERSGSFAPWLSRLRTRGLLVDVDRSHVRASDDLYPPGLK